jgi:predicted regulator of amino acid metabolism with ACT domain
MHSKNDAEFEEKPTRKTMLKIYGRPNSLNVRKVLWLCDEIGIPNARTAGAAITARRTIRNS